MYAPICTSLPSTHVHMQLVNASHRLFPLLLDFSRGGRLVGRQVLPISLKRPCSKSAHNFKASRALALLRWWPPLKKPFRVLTSCTQTLG